MDVDITGHRSEYSNGASSCGARYLFMNIVAILPQKVDDEPSPSRGPPTVIFMPASKKDMVIIDMSCM